MSPRNVIVLTSLALLFFGCSTGGPQDGSDLDPRRRPLGKADSQGTCQGACGGQSQDGSCWCDELCEFYGDCCDDYAPSCTDDPQSCGGIDGLPCPEGQFCSYGEGAACGAPDQLGVCQPEPDACIEIFAPVCGCDGVTYGNECHAHAAGTNVASYGPCEDEDPDLCLDDDECDPGETCDTSECHMPPCPDGMDCPQVCYGVCSDEPPPPSNGCEGYCGGPAPSGCYCDDLCTAYGDCCDDYQDVCEPEEACCDPAAEPGTNGNPTCFEGATCCADGSWTCNAGDGSPICGAPGTVCGM